MGNGKIEGFHELKVLVYELTAANAGVLLPDGWKALNHEHMDSGKVSILVSKWHRKGG